jgi:hypothetical protein
VLVKLIILAVVVVEAHQHLVMRNGAVVLVLMVIFSCQQMRGLQFLVAQEGVEAAAFKATTQQ